MSFSCSALFLHLGIIYLLFHIFHSMLSAVASYTMYITKVLCVGKYFLKFVGFVSPFQNDFWHQYCSTGHNCNYSKTKNQYWLNDSILICMCILLISCSHTWKYVYQSTAQYKIQGWRTWGAEGAIAPPLYKVGGLCPPLLSTIIIVN